MQADKYAKAKKLVDELVEPKVQKIVDTLNKTLAQFGIRAGVELQWFFEEVKQDEQSSSDKSKN